MDDAASWRWERVLLVLAALFGVVAMHSTVGPMHEPGMPPPPAVASIDQHRVAPIAVSSAVASMSSVERAVAALAPSPDMPGDGPMPMPMPMPRALMHLCLAILSSVIVLGLLAIAILILLGHEPTPSRTPLPAASGPSRPPRRTALRLAQLCVLRN